MFFPGKGGLGSRISDAIKASEHDKDRITELQNRLNDNEQNIDQTLGLASTGNSNTKNNGKEEFEGFIKGKSTKMNNDLFGKVWDAQNAHDNGFSVLEALKGNDLLKVRKDEHISDFDKADMTDGSDLLQFLNSNQEEIQEINNSTSHIHNDMTDNISQLQQKSSENVKEIPYPKLDKSLGKDHFSQQAAKDGWLLLEVLKGNSDYDFNGKGKSSIKNKNEYNKYLEDSNEAEREFIAAHTIWEDLQQKKDDTEEKDKLNDEELLNAEKRLQNAVNRLKILKNHFQTFTN